jgi:hypothetical protein
MELLEKKEKENYQLYIKERTQRQIIGKNTMMNNNAKIMSREGQAL